MGREKLNYSSLVRKYELAQRTEIELTAKIDEMKGDL